MAIIIPNGLTTQEIRLLQEYRRISAEVLTPDALGAIRHPDGNWEEPAQALVRKGYLVASDGSYTLTEKAKTFLAIDAKP